jgi:hypothetical protein
MAISVCFYCVGKLVENCREPWTVFDVENKTFECGSSVSSNVALEWLTLLIRIWGRARFECRSDCLLSWDPTYIGPVFPATSVTTFKYLTTSLNCWYDTSVRVSNVKKWRHFLRVRRLPAQLKWILPSSCLLRGVRWFDTDVSGLHTGPIFKGQAVSLEDGTDRWSWNVGF